MNLCHSVLTPKYMSFSPNIQSYPTNIQSYPSTTETQTITQNLTIPAVMKCPKTYSISKWKYWRGDTEA